MKIHFVGQFVENSFNQKVLFLLSFSKYFKYLTRLGSLVRILA